MIGSGAISPFRGLLRRIFHEPSVIDALRILVDEAESIDRTGNGKVRFFHINSHVLAGGAAIPILCIARNDGRPQPGIHGHAAHVGISGAHALNVGFRHYKVRWAFENAQAFSIRINQTRLNPLIAYVRLS